MLNSMSPVRALDFIIEYSCLILDLVAAVMTLLYDYVLTFAEEVSLQSGAKCMSLYNYHSGGVYMAAKNEHSKSSSCAICCVDLTRLPRAKFFFYL
jgi:hypothetical protein